MSNPTALEGINEARGQVELGNVEFVGVGGFGGVRIGGVFELVEVAAESFEGFFAEEGGIGRGDGGGEESGSGLEARFEGGPRGVAVGSEEVVEVGLGVQRLQPNGGSGSSVWPLVEFERRRLVNGRNAYERSHFGRERDNRVSEEDDDKGQW